MQERKSSRFDLPKHGEEAEDDLVGWNSSHDLVLGLLFPCHLSLQGRLNFTKLVPTKIKLGDDIGLCWGLLAAPPNPFLLLLRKMIKDLERKN